MRDGIISRRYLSRLYVGVYSTEPPEDLAKARSFLLNITLDIVNTVFFLFGVMKLK